MRKIMLLVAIGAFTPTSGWAETATVRSGIKAEITTHNRYDSQCRPIRIVIKILAAPAHGTVTSEPKGIVVPAEAKQCAGKTIDGVAIYYQSKPGFVGEDSFRYQRSSPDHPTDRLNREASFTVTVR